MQPAGMVGVGSVVGLDFRLVAPLRSGGMGSVWRAEQLSTGRPRALKLMHPALLDDPRCRERFVQEAQIGSRIASEHVVDVIAAGIDDRTGTPWLAMELLEGEDLAELVTRRGPLPVEEVALLARQLGHALGAAHDAGIVHRDLKPENLFLARARRVDAPLTLKVLDFGIARLLQESKLATASQVIGSPMWMAPEQVTPGARIGPATDVWAVGLIVFYLLAGRSYWRSTTDRGGNVQSLLAEILVHPLDSPSFRAVELGSSAGLPADLDGWFASCVARDQAERFRDARSALDALVEVLTTGGRTTVPELGPPATSSPLPVGGRALPETLTIAAVPSLVGEPPTPATRPRPLPGPLPEQRASPQPQPQPQLQPQPQPTPQPALAATQQMPMVPDAARALGVTRGGPARPAAAPAEAGVAPGAAQNGMPPALFLGLVLGAIALVTAGGIALSQC